MAAWENAPLAEGATTGPAWASAPLDDSGSLRASVNAAAAASPEVAASAARLARQAGLPSDLVHRNLPAVQQRMTVERVDADTAQAPVLRGRYTDPAFAAMAHDDSSALAAVEQHSYTAGNALRKGVASMKLTLDFLADRLAGAVGADRSETRRILGETATYYQAQGADPGLAAAGERAKTAGGGTWYGTLAHLPGEVAASGDAMGILGRFLTEQLPASVAGFGLGAAASAPLRSAITSRIRSELVAKGVNAGIAGAAGNGTAVFVQSLGTNYAEGVSQGLPEQQAAQRAWKKTLAEVPANATAGALMGLKIGPNQLTNILGQAATQGAGGGIGAAQAAHAVGEEADPVEIALEILGEGVSAAPEVAGLTYSRITSSSTMQRAEAAQAALDGGEELGRLIQAADQSKLKARDPETFAEFVAQSKPDAVVYVAPEHLAALDLSAVPAVAEQARTAALDGGDVAVPLSDLLAHLPGEQLLPHLRREPEAMTAAEAQAFDGHAELTDELGRPAPVIEGALLSAPEQAAMSPEGWAAYQQRATEAAQAAVEQRQARAQRDLQWLANRKDEALRKVARQAEEARGAIEAEALAEVRQQPVYAAIRFLAHGELADRNRSNAERRVLESVAGMSTKLDLPALKEMYGEGPAAPWRYLSTGKAGLATAKGGLHPDIAAEILGFDSGDQMVREILAARPEAEAVAELTEQRMLERRPDIADTIARERAAEALIADRARTRFLATEAAALAQAVGNRVLLAQEARRYAESTIARKTVRDARPAQFKAAAARAGRQADEAFRKGDTALAAKWKQGQVLQSALQDEATVAQNEVAQALRRFRRMLRRNDGSRDGNLADLARAVLAQYGIGEADKPLSTYLDRIGRYDPDLRADLAALTEELPAAGDEIKAMTVADFRVMRDRVEAIWSLAKSTREIEIDGQKVAIEQAAEALAAQLGSEPAAKREAIVGANEKLKLRFELGGMRAALRRVEHWADARDRGDARGPFRTYVWQPISEAVTRYRAERNRHVNRFLELLKPIEPTLKPGKIAAPELGTTFADRSALLHALLHTGNESNKRKLLLGYKWAAESEDGSLDTSRWDAFLARMHTEKRITAADWQFVQGVWTLLEEMKPAAQAAHRRMFGFEFSEITAEPVQTPFGDLAGGYVPAITDSLQVQEARTHGAMDDMLAGQNSPMFPAVGRGFTKARVEDYTKPLALDLRLLPAHIDKVARFSVLGPVLRDAARLVTRNVTFRDAMNAVDPTAIEDMLTPWLKRAAAQTLSKAPETKGGRILARVANTARNRTGLLLMAGNVVNTLQQITGLSVAALRVKPRLLASGLMELMRSPAATAQAINELSPWMQQRSDNGARDIEQSINDLLTNPGLLKRAEQFGNRYGYALQQSAQNLLDRVVWLGAYRQSQAGGIDDAQAVRSADAMVRMTQGSFAPEDASAVEYANAFTRLFLQFASYFNGQLNFLSTEFQNARGDAGRMAMVYLLGFAVPAFLADVIGKAARGQLGGDDDDDEGGVAAQLLESFFMSQARYALAMVPVVSQVGNALLGQFTPERFDDRISASPALSAAEATIRAPFSIYKAANDESSLKTAVRDFLTATQMLTGAPTGLLVRPLGYLADEDRGDELSLRGLVTGRAAD